MPDLVLRVPLRSGVCRWCRCTWDDPCPPGCAWVDRAQTLCSACAPFDKALRSAAGRQRAVEAFLIGREAAEDSAILIALEAAERRVTRR